MKVIDIINYIGCEYLVVNVRGEQSETIEFTSNNYKELKKYYDYNVDYVHPIGNVVNPKPGYLEMVIYK